MFHWVFRLHKGLPSFFWHVNVTVLSFGMFDIFLCLSIFDVLNAYAACGILTISLSSNLVLRFFHSACGCFPLYFVCYIQTMMQYLEKDSECVWTFSIWTADSVLLYLNGHQLLFGHFEFTNMSRKSGLRNIKPRDNNWPFINAAFVITKHGSHVCVVVMALRKTCYVAGIIRFDVR